MEKYSSNGEYKTKIKRFFSSVFGKTLENFTKGKLEIQNIEINESSENVVLSMKFKGGGKQVFKIINDFYRENKNRVQQDLKAEDFGIILLGDEKIFEARISLPKDVSEEKKQIAKGILEELKQKLLSV